MADTKITALTALTAADPANDVIPIVDVSDTTMAASGTTKKISVNNILGASGTATLASATITGALGAAGLNVTGATIPANGVYLGSANNLSFSAASTLGMTLNSTGLGVQASPSAPLCVKTRNSDSVGLRVLQSTGGTSGIQFTDDPVTADWGSVLATSTDLIVRSNSTLLLQTGGATTRATIDTSGNVGIGVTPAGTGGCLQLKSGITFPATQVASADANTLDDYEEGTWTPTITFATLSVGVTYSTQTAIYTKVGRIVHFSGRIDLSSKGTSIGGAAIAGLPFSANTGAASVGFQTSIAPSGSQAMLTIDGATLIVRYASTTTTAQSTNSDFSNSSIIIFSGTYAV